GVEEIFEINLSASELEALQASAALVDENCKSLAALLG
ncbi:MAG: malate dehydrogenase, partial [Chlorobiaceae bacterium]